MSKLFVITLSLIILVQSAGIGVNDILQLDELIEHAQFHKQEYGDSFFVFLSKHYGEQKAEHSKNHQEEQKDHEQLPFQYQGHTLSVIALVNSENSHINTIEITDSTESNFHYVSSFSTLHKKGLLQPPKSI
ncbi:hypothetical protein [Winogradskyella alexanderae]|uniref:Uncharacterized protein n=1 Tax=Winogradskyella alexanderae TaxID=2877123 RepID=A0ABS7XPS3_9FLAO|nr:hypothetical protein [Winogradskyella alexanderae]MCA0131394.1 hypothetical protein [Winogradskyella alexanderae]